MGELTSKEKDGHTINVEFLYSIALFMLALHILWFCFEFFMPIVPLRQWLFPGLNWLNQKLHLFDSPWRLKLFALFLLVLHALGSKGKLDQTISRNQIGQAGSIGLSVYLLSTYILYAKGRVHPMLIDSLYLIALSIGVLYLTKAGQHLSRLVWYKNEIDIFNDTREEFPQNEVYEANDDSIHFRFRYYYQGVWREGIINVVNPFRAVMVMGGPGSGKTYFVLGPAIWQSIYKGYTAYIYDFKFPSLAESAYNAYCKTITENPWAWTKQLPAEEVQQRMKANDPLIPKFYIINFNDVEYSHRCNPLLPELMYDVMDAIESAKSIFFNLDKEAAKKSDFFSKSAINLLTAVIWYLRLVAQKYSLKADRLTDLKRLSEISPKDTPFSAQQAHELKIALRLKEVCTLPHVVEFFNRTYEEMFGVMSCYSDAAAYIGPFINALKNKAFEQVEGQIASVRIPIALLYSPQIYWIMTGNDFSLDINNPADPKIICAGNNPARREIIGVALSLFATRMMKLINQEEKLKSAIFLDELPTIFMRGIDVLVNTARSNKVAVWLGLQDFEQLKKEFGLAEAEVIINTVGNYFTGQIAFKTAEMLSKLFGKSNQEKESMSLSKQDNSFSVSQQQAELLPPSKLMGLRTGEFAGQFADNLGQTFEFRKFKAHLANEPEVMKNNHKIPRFNDVSHLIYQHSHTNELWPQVNGKPVETKELSPQQRDYFKELLLKAHVKRIVQDVDILIKTEAAEHNLTITDTKEYVGGD